MVVTKSALCTVAALIWVAAWPLPARAECWNGKVQCAALKDGGDPAMHQCKAYSCSNVHGVALGWDYPDGTKVSASATTDSGTAKINGKPAIQLPESITKRGYLCMTRPASQTYYCSVDLPH